MIVLPFRRTAEAIPAEHRPNFWHLYLDIAWYGVLSGSAISFMVIFATRLGANGLQIGLLNASPAIVSLFFTLPVGQWLQKHPIRLAVFWTSVWHRMFYAAWIFLPLLFSAPGQIQALIWLTLAMSVPGTAMAVGFNALFAEAVPPEWRGHVAGIRNGLLALVFMVVSLLCGLILEWLPFPVGYQVVFGLGFIGGVMSSYHLWFVRPAIDGQDPARLNNPVNDMARPGYLRTLGDGRLATVGLRFLTRLKQPWLNLELLRGPYSVILLLFFVFHLTQYLAIPLFPLYWVNHLHLTDQEISLGNAVFYGAVLIGSSQLARLTRRLGNRHLMAVGIAAMSVYPALTAVTHTLQLFLITSALGGLAWSMVGGASANYLLEKIPEDQRPAHLAWYNLALNAAVLGGSLIGPALAGAIGIVAALALAAAGRFLAAIGLWRWG
ncbi:MAG: MFS transporter [Ardenticatenaceae bacterium]|nr:MFS transporter [Ardenticatenaceae bacterium]MCB9443978.1 MFS transporter [Ardenticatenaceae bacterium]